MSSRHLNSIAGIIWPSLNCAATSGRKALFSDGRFSSVMLNVS